MSSTTVVSIDQTVGFKNQVHCTEYLVNGELKTWSLADNKQAPQKQSAQHGK